MTIEEQEFVHKVPYYLREIAKHLEKANKLKALELKGKSHRDIIDPDCVDSVMAEV